MAHSITSVNMQIWTTTFWSYKPQLFFSLVQFMNKHKGTWNKAERRIVYNISHYIKLTWIFTAQLLFTKKNTC